MSALDIEPVATPSFSLTPSLSDERFVIKLSGNADMSASSTLSVYLKAVHAEAVKQRVREVTFDLHELYFMNSSCFKSFITWIEAASSARDSTYRIKFLANAKLHWQRRSLEALRCLAAHIVSVDS
jgi:hypothetical protein